MRTALGLLALATCIPGIAFAASISGAGTSSISLQFEPQGSRSRGGAVSVRAQGAARDAGREATPEAVEFDQPTALSQRSPMGACASANGANTANGDCRDTLLLTGKKPGNDGPLDLNDWESDDEEQIWPDTLPGQSNEELVTSAFVPKDSDSVGELDADELGGGSAIGGGNSIGDVPEPSTMLLVGGSLFALGYFRKKRNS